MAQFKLVLPTEEIKKLEKLSNNADKMLEEMVEAGAKVTLNNVKSNVPQSWKDSEIMQHIFLSKTYKTPTDDGINIKVMISGYFTNKNGVRTPAPLVANVFEYGSSKFAKRPFFRKSFNKAQITKAMLEVEKKYIKD